MINFPFFLEHAANVFIEIVDDPEKFDMNEGDVIFWAEWARDVYKNRERIQKYMDEFRYEVYCNKHKKYIADNVPSNHIGFKFGDISPQNVNDAIALYNEILD